MEANDSKSYLGQFNKLADEYNNSYHSSIRKDPIDVDDSALTEEIQTNLKAPKFKAARVRMALSSGLIPRRIEVKI